MEIVTRTLLPYQFRRNNAYGAPKNLQRMLDNITGAIGYPNIISYQTAPMQLTIHASGHSSSDTL